jgi:hypothetical protein
MTALVSDRPVLLDAPARPDWLEELSPALVATTPYSPHISEMTAILPAMLPPRAVAAIFASRGGNTTSEAKRSSAQVNGRKGGRPFRMVMTIFAGIAEFERTLIISRTSDGRLAAKARGVAFGRPKKMRPDQQELARELVRDGKSISAVARTFNVHPATIHRVLER